MIIPKQSFDRFVDKTFHLDKKRQLNVVKEDQAIPEKKTLKELLRETAKEIKR